MHDQELVRQDRDHPSVVFTEDAPGVEDAMFLTQWLFGKNEKTQRAYRFDIDKFYEFVQKPLRNVTLSDLQRFVGSLGDLKPATQIRRLAAVKSALSFGLEIGWLRVNVGRMVKLPRLENKLAERIMSEQSVARLLALETDPPKHAMLVLLYRGGLRCAELCNLSWRNLHERDQTGQISVFGKGNKTRQILLDQATWRELLALKPAGAGLDVFVFPSKKGQLHIDESTVFRIVQQAGLRIGIEGVSPHWMRHAHATHSLENGAPISLVRDTLGHASIETTSKYTHVRPSSSSGHYLKV